MLNIFQSNRTLSWKPFLGVANIEIELKDRTLNLSVSPVLATIIWHFQTKRKLIFKIVVAYFPIGLLT